MAQAARQALQGLHLLGGRAGWAAQQCSGFSSLTLGSWWQGSSSSAASTAAALGWQRLRDLLPAPLADAQWLAVPKRKVRLAAATPNWAALPAVRAAAPGAGHCPVGARGSRHTMSLTPPLPPPTHTVAPPPQVTPHRKGKRSANKFIRFVPVVSQCSQCQRVFPQHAMPSKCEEDDCPAFNLRRRPDSPAAAEPAAEQ